MQARKKSESLLHGQEGQERVPYFADNVFADQTEQYPEICETLTGSRKYALSSFMLQYFFFLGFLFFMYQINTARGMGKGQWKKMRVTRVFENYP